MKSGKKCVLTINGGSSSIKFSLYRVDETLIQLFKGKIENINSKNTAFNYHNSISKKIENLNIGKANYNDATNYLLDWLQKQDGFDLVKAIGHRIVHGMKHTKPEQITPELISELKEISVFDTEHLPGEIKLIEAFQEKYHFVPQVACFDTSFHTSMPTIAKLLPIPRRYYEMDVQRYGFHGLSYSYIMEELERLAGNESVHGRIILAHLGNGASIAAVKQGKCIDTSMGFTPTSGLPMGTRTGDLDPGIAVYLLQKEKLSTQQYNHLINHESGLLGVSETSADMRELLKSESIDSRAAEAIDLFCYQTKKWIGSYAAVLGGLDTLVFTGGIGEHAPEVRDRICGGLEFLGIELDESRNVKNETIISTDASKVILRVLKTNEELMIARLVCNILNYPIKN